mgnify:CR=1 FL=1
MLLALVPPYGALLDAPDLPALGTLLVADTAHGAEEAAWALDEANRRAPWCVPCLVARADETVAEPPHGHGSRPAMTPLPEDERLTPAPLLPSIRLRVAPWPADLAEWVAERLDRPALAPALEELFLRPSFALGEEALLAEETREELFQAGRLKPHEWHQLAGLATLATTRPAPSQVDGTHRLAMRTLLGVTPEAFRQRLGWEWVLERGLRAAGYHGARRITPAGYPLHTS